MNMIRLAAAYLNLYTTFRNRTDAKHARKKTYRYGVDTRVLTASDKRQMASAFAGCGTFDPVFHAFYKEKAGSFNAYYLPTDLYYTAIDPYFNPLMESKVLDNKCLYGRLFPHIPQAETVVMRMGGHWYDAQYRHLTAKQAVALVAAEPAVFLKVATGSSGGSGVVYLGSEDGSVSERFEQETAKHAKDVVVQCPIRQHASISALNASSVNTLRILTLLTKEEVKLYSAVVRIGIDGSKVDNATAGGIFCGICEGGMLRETAYLLNGTPFDRHPTNGLVFDGHRIVNFDRHICPCRIFV